MCRWRQGELLSKVSTDFLCQRRHIELSCCRNVEPLQIGTRDAHVGLRATPSSCSLRFRKNEKFLWHDVRMRQCYVTRKAVMHNDIFGVGATTSKTKVSGETVVLYPIDIRCGLLCPRPGSCQLQERDGNFCEAQKNVE